MDNAVQGLKAIAVYKFNNNIIRMYRSTALHNYLEEEITVTSSQMNCQSKLVLAVTIELYN